MAEGLLTLVAIVALVAIWVGLIVVAVWLWGYEEEDA